MKNDQRKVIFNWIIREIKKDTVSDRGINHSFTLGRFSRFCNKSTLLPTIDECIDYLVNAEIIMEMNHKVVKINKVVFRETCAKLGINTAPINANLKEVREHKKEEKAKLIKEIRVSNRQLTKKLTEVRNIELKKAKQEKRLQDAINSGFKRPILLENEIRDSEANFMLELEKANENSDLALILKS